MPTLPGMLSKNAHCKPKLLFAGSFPTPQQGLEQPAVFGLAVPIAAGPQPDRPGSVPWYGPEILASLARLRPNAAFTENFSNNIAN